MNTLVRQKHLPTKAKQQAVFELGKDFLSAGLYDRAETCLIKLLKSKDYGLKSLSLFNANISIDERLAQRH